MSRDAIGVFGWSFSPNSWFLSILDQSAFFLDCGVLHGGPFETKGDPVGPRGKPFGTKGDPSWTQHGSPLVLKGPPK